MGSSTFTAIQESAGDGQTKGVSETVHLHNLYQRGSVLRACRSKDKLSHFPSHAIVLSTLTFSYYTASKLVLRPSSHAACIALDLDAASLRTHEAAKEDEVHR